MLSSTRRLEWKNLELTISQRKTILVKDVSSDAKESLGEKVAVIRWNHNAECNLREKEMNYAHMQKHLAIVKLFVCTWQKHVYIMFTCISI